MLRFYSSSPFFPLDSVELEKMWDDVTAARQLKEQFPDFVAGFDLVGQEDKGFPLKDLIEPLLWLSEGEVFVPVFYHAGETGEFGGSPGCGGEGFARRTCMARTCAHRYTLAYTSTHAQAHM